MSNIYFIGDSHWGHFKIIEYCNRQYTSVQDMDEGLIENWNRVVKPNDTIYHLGDVTWYGSDKTSQIFKRLNGHKHLIIGNHDHRKNLSPFFETINEYLFTTIKGIPIALMHYPILSWNRMSHGAIHLHGHTHNTCDNSGTLRFDMGVDCWDMTPASLEQVIELVPIRLKQNETKLQKPVEKFNQLIAKASKDSGNLTEEEKE